MLTSKAPSWRCRFKGADHECASSSCAAGALESKVGRKAGVLPGNPVEQDARTFWQGAQQTAKLTNGHRSSSFHRAR